MSTEQNKQIIKEINKEITEAELTELKTQVRAYKQSQLEQDEQLKREIAEREEKRRIIKLNLANLDKGDFSAIEERMRKSKVAQELSLIWGNLHDSTVNLTGFFNPNWTTGTFQIKTPFGNKNFYF
jgi:hypothetical protein